MKKIKIAKDMVVALGFKVKEADGTLIGDSHNTFEYLHGGYENIFTEIEKGLEGLTVGDHLSVSLPVNTFGDFDDELVLVEDASALPNNLRLGSVFELIGEELIFLRDNTPVSSEAEIVFNSFRRDLEDKMIYRVTDMADGKVVLDGNHPLAGSELSLDIVVLSVRAANREEIDQGHANLSCGKSEVGKVR